MSTQSQPVLQQFDRDLSLAELLPPQAASEIVQTLRELLGGEVRVLDLQDRAFAGPAAVTTHSERVAVPLTLQLDTVGFLEAPGPLPRVQAAAKVLEQILQAGARYCMAADLHLEAVRADYQRLQEEHTALLASEARLRELSENLEHRVQEQVQTIEGSQRSLYQAEKLAAVGQLAAGVAHEINNPVGFVRSNLNTARGYGRKLVALGKLARIDQGQAWSYWQKEGLTEVLEDFDALLDESISGADRVTKIVSDLKTFASQERDESEPLDLNDNLSVVCSVAEGQVPEAARITLDLQPLPLYTCAAGRINQVFLNLLLNAVHAIGAGGEIRVGSVFFNGEIRINFQDDGCGISEENLSRIFDPFFTTRAVGSGTGLGLTVSRDIVRGYGGRLDISSRVGHGTCVSVCLPLPGQSVGAA
jgi:two-component system, NtrC family, sensor kinase